MTTSNLYDALRESHERQRSLCRRLLRSKPGTRERLDLFTALRIELAAHEAAEERYLYVPMLMDDGGLDASRHALHEHHEIDELVADVQKLDPRGEPWLEKARELSHEVHHHLREEERKFFQVSGKILSDAAKRRLAAGYRRDFERMVRKLSAK
ncbi:MAG TPA: hemerythrin domain-containing protein [Thermomonas sp.]|nr:hemerythrin domain-containing protein [Thermomonas sp.]